MKRFGIAACIALGLAGISVALGMLYLDFVRREGAWVEATMRGPTMNASQQDALLLAWTETPGFVTALTSGTIGVVLLGLGGVMMIFELRWFAKTSVEPSKT